jgi:dihydrofolate reductase
MSDLEQIRKLKQRPGKDMYVGGGAMLVSSMINLGLIDELRLMIHPVLLGGGKALFKGVTERHRLKLVSSEQRGPGKVHVIYSVYPPGARSLKKPRWSRITETIAAGR